jgi:uncharacterized protein (TIGR04255 family)
MTIPKKITPCPIIECAIELRFRTSVEPGAVFGIVYTAFRNEYPNVEKMPILNVPEQIRLVDPNMVYQPWYRLRNGGFLLSIGPKKVALGKVGEYPGWSLFSIRLHKVVETLRGLGIVDEVERVGLRYINFFDFDIFDKIKLVVSIDNVSVTSNQTLVRVTIPGQRYKSQMHVTNQASVIVEKTNRTGSIIDIDTFLETDLKDFFQNSISIIEEGHTEEKEVFFSLPKNDFLQTLNPEY